MYAASSALPSERFALRNTARYNKSNGATYMSTPKKSVKKTAKPAAKTTKPATLGAAALARVYKVKKQFDGGVREEFIKAIPKDGAPLEVIAKKAGVDIRKAKGYAYWLTANGYLTRVDA